MPSPKKPVPKLDLKRVLAAVDRKDRDFYDKLTPEEQKTFHGLVPMRFTSSVQGNADLQAYYLISTNKHANKRLFEISTKHRKLQWLVLTTISPGMGVHYHPWIKLERKSDKKIKELEKLYPQMKTDDLEVLAQLMSDKELKQLIKDNDFDS